jgi:hypothetical protein
MTTCIASIFQRQQPLAPGMARPQFSNQGGNEMVCKKLALSILLSLWMVALAGCSGLPRTPGEPTTAEGPRITVKGQIGYMTNLGGYFVRGFEPGGEMIIVNKDPQVLEALFKSRQTVLIVGRIVRGAEYLFIETIDGKPYTAK